MAARQIQHYLDLAEKTGAFHPGELEVLREVLEETFAPRDGVGHYCLLEERDGSQLLGFIIFGRTPLTQHGWDIYWLIVDKSMHRRGVGSRLVSSMQQEVLKKDRAAVIRIETSGKKEYAYVRSFYTKAGFTEAGRIADFYAPGDDLVIFSKTITYESDV
ncbi:MAG: GNAT family N-acetyltransferase [Desulfobacterota bacterium]|nr:GNAT family N-acetyltransferase [Thermodesulfobacteriota bacterium]